MRALTLNEQANVSGCGEYFDNFSVLGAKTGAILMSPIAFIAAALGSSNPYAPPRTSFLAFAMIDGFGYFVGAVLGGTVGAYLDLLEGGYDEITTNS